MKFRLAQFVVLVLCLMLVSAKTQAEKGYKVLFEGKQFNVAVAITRQDRLRGLMGRNQLEKDEGLLIVLPESGQVPVWMKNMKIPLDVIWITYDGEIVDIRPLQPCRVDPCPIYKPRAAAKYILEVAEGNFTGKIGDTIAIFDASGDSLLP
ncbi:MAG: DUF192 domain-containing protein [Gammaproteobacteria bacterium]|nr:MAG: DUF192 domain-containing protein [Gammaproteobacteria bacterium]